MTVLETHEGTFTSPGSGVLGFVDLPFTTTPAVGDVYIVVTSVDRGPGMSSSVSGLGATWTVAKSDVFISNQQYKVYVGTGATAAGNVQVGWTASSTALTCAAWVIMVRGIDPVFYFEQKSAWDTGDSIPSSPTTREFSGTGGPGTLALAIGLPSFSPGSLVAPSATSSSGFTTSILSLNSNISQVVSWRELSTTASVTIGYTATGGGYAPLALFWIGGPDGARLTGEYAEVATGSLPTWAFDQSGGVGQTASGTTFPVDITTAAVGAHCYVGVALNVNAPTITLPGWTQLGPTTSTASTLAVAIFYRKKQSGDTTFTGTQTSGRSAIGWVSYTGLRDATPHETVDAGNFTVRAVSQTGVATPSVSEVGGNSVALGFFATRTSTTGNRPMSVTPDPAMTERLDRNNDAAASGPWVSLEIADTNGLVTAGAHQYTGTQNFAELYAVGVLLYLESATTSTSALALDGEYAEVLSQGGASALALDGTYTEVLTGLDLVPPPPPLTMVEAAISPLSGIVSNPVSAALVTTPLPGDYVFACVDVTTNASGVTVSLAGLGATWTQVPGSVGQGTTGLQTFFVGTGATSAGIVTATLNANKQTIIDLYLVRGITGPPSLVRESLTRVAASLVGPSQQALSGGIVFGIAAAGNAMTWPSSQTPAGAWTVAAQRIGATDRASSAYAIPSGRARYGTALTTGSTTNLVIAQLAVFPPPPPSAVVVEGAMGFWGILQASS